VLESYKGEEDEKKKLWNEVKEVKGKEEEEKKKVKKRKANEV
jgi:hypothetical protein